jgi:ABC-type nitrate/sulfonate/bicarbonate transport system ATPase subunit
MIDIKNLTITYEEESNSVFSQFNLHIRKGESISILGPSGCGKTTLLYLIAGLLKPNEGKILIEGKEVTRPRPSTGLILQEYGLLPWATLKENYELGTKIRNYYGSDGIHSPKSIKGQAGEVDWLEELKLKQHLDKYPSQLSGGQRQRTAIARTLALSPDILLMDEPFSSLDIQARESLQDLIIALKVKYNLTLLAVSHSISEAALLGEKILILNNPPNSKPKLVINQENDLKNFRNSKSYLEICNKLKGVMGEII